MGWQTPLELWSAWLEQLAQRQEDGTYIIRPWGTYQVHTNTKSRWLRFELGFACILLGALIAILWIVSDDSLSTAQVVPLMFSICAAVMIARYVGLLAIVRPTQWVPKERWKEPAVADPESRFSRGGELTVAVSSAALTGFGGAVAVVALLVPSATNFWSAVQIIVVFGALFLSSLVRLLWRSARASTVLQVTPVVLIIVWFAVNAPVRWSLCMMVVILTWGMAVVPHLLGRWRARRKL
jgi:hypothetical protein